jgi:hypothetical protein
MVDCDHPTLLVDEADDLLRRKPDLKHVVNAGWSRGTKIHRVVQGVVREFDPFCAKVIALKGSAMPDTTASRSIVVDLWPKQPDEKVEDFLFADSPEFQELRRKLARWSADNAATLAEAKPALPPGFNNRRAANWRLLLAVADHAAGDWPKRARLAATKLLSRQNAEPSVGIRLLTALQEIFANRNEITSAELVQLLAADPDAEWGAFRGRAAISQRELAAQLKPYDVRPVVLHPDKRSNLSRHGYRLSQFTDAFARFLPANIRTSEHQG